MASAAAAIYAKLSGDAGVISLVSLRIWPQEAPEENSVYPRIVYDTSEGNYPVASDGPIGAGSKRIKVYCIGQSYADMRAVSDAVVSSLNGQTGTWGGTVVQGCFFDDDSESEQATDAGQDEQVFVNEMDFTIFHNT